MSRTIIADNIQKVSERLDVDGNVIDPRTKQIIKKANEEVTEKKDE